MSSPKRIYWDACVWISYIQQETKLMPDGSLEKRYAQCSQILQQAEAGKIEIVTSTFTLAEVCKPDYIRTSGIDNLSTFFDSPYILLVNVDKMIGVKAQAMQASGLAGLKPPDAIHLASGLRAQVEEFHTYDQALLNLSGILTKPNGQPMKICKPGSLSEDGLFSSIEN